MNEPARSATVLEALAQRVRSILRAHEESRAQADYLELCSLLSCFPELLPVYFETYSAILQEHSRTPADGSLGRLFGMLLAGLGDSFLRALGKHAARDSTFADALLAPQAYGAALGMFLERLYAFLGALMFHMRESQVKALLEEWKRGLPKFIGDFSSTLLCSPITPRLRACLYVLLSCGQAPRGAKSYLDIPLPEDKPSSEAADAGKGRAGQGQSPASGGPVRGDSTGAPSSGSRGGLAAGNAALAAVAESSALAAPPGLPGAADQYVIGGDDLGLDPAQPESVPERGADPVASRQPPGFPGPPASPGIMLGASPDFWASQAKAVVRMPSYTLDVTSYRDALAEAFANCDRHLQVTASDVFAYGYDLQLEQLVVKGLSSSAQFYARLRDACSADGGLLSRKLASPDLAGISALLDAVPGAPPAICVRAAEGADWVSDVYRPHLAEAGPVLDQLSRPDPAPVPPFPRNHPADLPAGLIPAAHEPDIGRDLLAVYDHEIVLCSPSLHLPVAGDGTPVFGPMARKPMKHSKDLILRKVINSLVPIDLTQLIWNVCEMYAGEPLMTILFDVTFTKSVPELVEACLSSPPGSRQTRFFCLFMSDVFRYVLSAGSDPSVAHIGKLSIYGPSDGFGAWAAVGGSGGAVSAAAVPPAAPVSATAFTVLPGFNDGDCSPLVHTSTLLVALAVLAKWAAGRESLPAAQGWGAGGLGGGGSGGALGSSGNRANPEGREAKGAQGKRKRERADRGGQDGRVGAADSVVSPVSPVSFSSPSGSGSSSASSIAAAAQDAFQLSLLRACIRSLLKMVIAYSSAATFALCNPEELVLLGVLSPSNPVFPPALDVLRSRGPDQAIALTREAVVLINGALALCQKFVEAPQDSLSPDQGAISLAEAVVGELAARPAAFGVLYNAPELFELYHTRVLACHETKLAQAAQRASAPQRPRRPPPPPKRFTRVHEILPASLGAYGPRLLSAAALSSTPAGFCQILEKQALALDYQYLMFLRLWSGPLDEWDGDHILPEPGVDPEDRSEEAMARATFRMQAVLQLVASVGGNATANASAGANSNAGASAFSPALPPASPPAPFSWTANRDPLRLLEFHHAFFGVRFMTELLRVLTDGIPNRAIAYEHHLQISHFCYSLPWTLKFSRTMAYPAFRGPMYQEFQAALKGYMAALTEYFSVDGMPVSLPRVWGMLAYEKLAATPYYDKLCTDFETCLLQRKVGVAHMASLIFRNSGLKHSSRAEAGGREAGRGSGGRAGSHSGNHAGRKALRKARAAGAAGSAQVGMEGGKGGGDVRVDKFAVGSVGAVGAAGLAAATSAAAPVEPEDPGGSDNSEGPDGSSRFSDSSSSSGLLDSSVLAASQTVRPNREASGNVEDSLEESSEDSHIDDGLEELPTSEQTLSRTASVATVASTVTGKLDSVVPSSLAAQLLVHKSAGGPGSPSRLCLAQDAPGEILSLLTSGFSAHEGAPLGPVVPHDVHIQIRVLIYRLAKRLLAYPENLDMREKNLILAVIHIVATHYAFLFSPGTAARLGHTLLSDVALFNVVLTAVVHLMSAGIQNDQLVGLDLECRCIALTATLGKCGARMRAFDPKSLPVFFKAYEQTVALKYELRDLASQLSVAKAEYLELHRRFSELSRLANPEARAEAESLHQQLVIMYQQISRWDELYKARLEESKRLGEAELLAGPEAAQYTAYVELQTEITRIITEDAAVLRMEQNSLAGIPSIAYCMFDGETGLFPSCGLRELGGLCRFLSRMQTARLAEDRQTRQERRDTLRAAYAELIESVRDTGFKLPYTIDTLVSSTGAICYLIPTAGPLSPGLQAEKLCSQAAQAVVYLKPTPGLFAALSEPLNTVRPQAAFLEGCRVGSRASRMLSARAVLTQVFMERVVLSEGVTNLELGFIEFALGLIVGFSGVPLEEINALAYSAGENGAEKPAGGPGGVADCRTVQAFPGVSAKRLLALYKQAAAEILVKVTLLPFLNAVFPNLAAAVVSLAYHRENIGHPRLIQVLKLLFTGENAEGLRLPSQEAYSLEYGTGSLLRYALLPEKLGKLCGTIYCRYLRRAPYAKELDIPLLLTNAAQASLGLNYFYTATFVSSFLSEYALDGDVIGSGAKEVEGVCTPLSCPAGDDLAAEQTGTYLYASLVGYFSTVLTTLHVCNSYVISGESASPLIFPRAQKLETMTKMLLIGMGDGYAALWDRLSGGEDDAEEEAGPAGQAGQVAGGPAKSALLPNFTACTTYCFFPQLWRSRPKTVARQVQSAISVSRGALMEILAVLQGVLPPDCCSVVNNGFRLAGREVLGLSALSSFAAMVAELQKIRGEIARLLQGAQGGALFLQRLDAAIYAWIISVVKK